MDHAVETLDNPNASEMTKLMTLQAAAKLLKYLPLYKSDPQNETFISELQIASFCSLAYIGMGITALGLSHTLGYALGSPYGIPHGITSCMTLGPVVVHKSHSSVSASQIARLAPFFGLASSGNDQKDTEMVGHRIIDLVKELGLQKNLTEYNVGRDQIPIIGCRGC